MRISVYCPTKNLNVVNMDFLLLSHSNKQISLSLKVLDFNIGIYVAWNGF